MTTNVMGSYIAMNEYLDPRGFYINPDGIYLNIVNAGTKKIIVVCDTIEEVGRWIQDTYGVNLIEEESHE